MLLRLVNLSLAQGETRSFRGWTIRGLAPVCWSVGVLSPVQSLLVCAHDCVGVVLGRTVSTVLSHKHEWLLQTKTSAAVQGEPSQFAGYHNEPSRGSRVWHGSHAAGNAATTYREYLLL